MISFGKSDIGKVRETNEDFIFFCDSKIGSLENLYIVSDGMGGHKSGEIASSLAVKSFVDYVKNNDLINPEQTLDFLVNALDFANKSVYEKSKSDTKFDGMGATLSVCTFFDSKAYCVHVGDSRIYSINNFGIKQLSIDHTYVNEMVRVGKITKEQAKYHPQKNIITRAVGIESEVQVDAFVIDCSHDDLFLICSDGLSSFVEDEQIYDIVCGEDDLDSKISSLINLANENGGKDNISAILIDCGGKK